MDIEINFKLLSLTTTEDFYELYPDANWDYDALSLNPNITDNIIDKYPYKPWNYIKMAIRKDMKHRFNKYDNRFKNR